MLFNLISPCVPSGCLEVDGERGGPGKNLDGLGYGAKSPELRGSSREEPPLGEIAHCKSA